MARLLLFRRREKQKCIYKKTNKKNKQQQKKLEIDPIITADIICNLVCDINDLTSCIKKG